MLRTDVLYLYPLRHSLRPYSKEQATSLQSIPNCYLFLDEKRSSSSSRYKLAKRESSALWWLLNDYRCPEFAHDECMQSAAISHIKRPKASCLWPFMTYCLCINSHYTPQRLVPLYVYIYTYINIYIYTAHSARLKYVAGWQAGIFANSR